MADEVKERKSLSPKAKKIINIVVDVIVAIILVFAAFLAVISIRSKAKGYGDYTEVFGTAYVAVASPSMDPVEASQKGFNVPEGKLEGFAEGDLIKLRLIDEKEAAKLEVGDIIAFETSEIVEGRRVLNTHRIVSVGVGQEGNASTFITRGDNNLTNDRESVLVSEIVGVYEGKASGIGHVFLFMSSSTGFFVCIVLPTLLIVAYCVFNLIMVIKKEKKVQAVDAELEKEAEKERLRQEILAEMQGGQNSEEAEKPEAPEPPETADPQPTEAAEEAKEETETDKGE